MERQFLMVRSADSMVIGALVWEGLRRKLLKPDRARGATVTSRTHP